MKESIFQKLKNLVFGEPEHEIIRLEEGISSCIVCNEKIKGKQIYKIPGSEDRYCKEHAREAMDKSREENFNSVPEKLKSKVHFSKEESFYLVCADCQKHLSVIAKSWDGCDHCNEAICKDHAEGHACQQKREHLRIQAEQSVPRRCEFCGKKIILDTSVKCDACFRYFCQAHAHPEHHQCRR